METSNFLSSPLALLIVTFVVLLPPLLIASFLLLRFITKQRGSEDYSYSNSNSNSRYGDLPFDIVIRILSCLPVKSLFRFKSVSKLWNNIISTDPYLASAHRTRNHHRNHIICRYQLKSELDRVRTVSISSPDEPFQHDLYYSSVICSSGDLGLLLLRNNRPWFSSSLDQLNYSLWNPATRQVNHLPRPPPFKHPDPDLKFFDEDCGVGLDPVANSVKVVLVRHYGLATEFKLLSSPVYVYTLGGGGWRKLAGDFPYSNGIPGPKLVRSTHLQGSIYWIGTHDSLPDMVTFDLGTDVFSTISFRPVYDLYQYRRVINGLCIYRNSIAVFTKLDYLSVDVWLLSSSGGVGDGEEGFRWIKHSSIGPLARELDVHGFWNDDRLLASPTQTWNDLVVFDMLQREIKTVIPNVRNFFEVFSYRETLVSP